MNSPMQSSRSRSQIGLVLLVTFLSLFAQAPSQAAKILYVINTVVDPVTTANPNDQEVFDRLTSQGHTVTLADDSTVSASDLEGMDLVLISSSTSSGEPGINPLARDVLRTGALGVVSYEPGLYDELLLQVENTFGNAGGHTSLAITETNKGHPLAAGKSGTVEIVVPGETATVSSSASPFTIGTNAVVIASNATPDVDVDRISIWAYDHGARLADNSTVTPGRKVAFFFNASTAPGVYNSNATDLFDAAIKWALERPASVPIRIVSRSPAPGQTSVPLDTSITAELEDGTSAQVDQSSIKLTLNGTPLTLSLSKTGNRTVATGKPAAPLPKSTAITAVITFSDTASPPNSSTETWQLRPNGRRWSPRLSMRM